MGLRRKKKKHRIITESSSRINSYATTTDSVGPFKETKGDELGRS